MPWYQVEVTTTVTCAVEANDADAAQELAMQRAEPTAELGHKEADVGQPVEPGCDLDRLLRHASFVLHA